MIGLNRKRFWKEVSVEPGPEGFAVSLDQRQLKTPAKSPLILPNDALALAVAEEWQAIEKEINPAEMPYTRAANAAIDKVAPQFEEVAAMLAEYGGSDLVCYRASHPQALVERQSAAWDPLLDWAKRELGVTLYAIEGVMHQPQPAETMERFDAFVRGYDPFELTALHDLVTISGSLVLGLAVARGKLSANEAWPIARLDEIWQQEQWGTDEEAVAESALKRRDFVFAEQFFRLAS